MIKVPMISNLLIQLQKEIVFEKNISIKQDVLGNEKVEFRIAGNGLTTRRQYLFDKFRYL